MTPMFFLMGVFQCGWCRSQKGRVGWQCGPCGSLARALGKEMHGIWADLALCSLSLQGSLEMRSVLGKHKESTYPVREGFLEYVARGEAGRELQAEETIYQRERGKQSRMSEMELGEEWIVQGL